MSTKSNFYLSDYTDGCFQYQYQSQGKEVKVNVIVEDCDLMIDGKSIGLTEDDLLGCNDIDDCTIAIARHIIKDNDGEVLTRFVDEYGQTLTHVPYVKRMDKNLEFINDTDDDSWYLTLCADGWRKPTSFNFCEVNEEDVPEIISMMENGDYGEVYEYLWESENLDTWELFNVWAEPNEEVLSFELNDETGKTVDEGKLLVSELNIYDYEDCQSTPVVDRSNHPKYFIVASDSVKGSCVSFCVPKDFKVGEIRFIESKPVGDSVLDVCEFGDWMTSMYSFKYQGKVYKAEDFCDNGTYGGGQIALYKWNGKKRKYDLISES